MNGDIELAKKMRDVFRAVEEITEDMGPGLRKGVWIREEFDCHDKCHFNMDTCAPNRGGFHGICSRRILMYVSVPGRGGVCQEFFTPIYLPETEARVGEYKLLSMWRPLGFLDLHVSNPTDEGKQRLTDVSIVDGDNPCIITATNACWVDGTSLQVEHATELLLTGGVEAVWSWLAELWLSDAVQMFGEDIYNAQN